MEIALKAMCLPAGSGVLVPAVTYVASGAGDRQRRPGPGPRDVHPDTWQLDADDAIRICNSEQAHQAP
jgi:dTDP-4-amino-4,6-dideoxygalactose transaminase